MTRQQLFRMITVATLGLSAPVVACSYYIDQAQVSQKLSRIAAAYLGQELDAANPPLVADLTFWESKPTFMCPKELTYKATVAFFSQATGCSTSVEVTHIEPWDTSANRPSDQFLVKALPQNCLPRN